MILATLGRWLRYAAIYRRVPDRRWVGTIYRESLPYGELESAGNGRIHWRTLDLTLGPEHRFLLQGPFARELAACCKARFRLEGGGIAQIEIGALRFAAEGWEDLFIAHEIFVRQIYRFTLPEPATIFDIGTNTAIAALAFAAQPRVRRVLGFEPFAPTLKTALGNLAGNAPALTGKIELHGYGLSDRDEQRQVEYNREFKGSMSDHGCRLPYAKAVNSTESIVLRDAADVLAPLFSRYRQDSALVLKIDCEGAETRILRRLDEAGLLPHATLMMIEWHGAGTENELLARLTPDFRCLALGGPDPELGMLYAFRAV